MLYWESKTYDGVTEKSTGVAWKNTSKFWLWFAVENLLFWLFDSGVFNRAPKYSGLMSIMFASRPITPRRYGVTSLRSEAHQYACEVVHQVRALQNGVLQNGVRLIEKGSIWLLAVVLWPAKAKNHMCRAGWASGSRQSDVIMIYLRVQHHRKSVTVMECNVININSDIIRMFYT